MSNQRLLNQSIKEEDTQKPPVRQDTKKQSSGEGSWVKPVDSPYVKAV